MSPETLQILIQRHFPSQQMDSQRILTGGCVGDVMMVEFSSGQKVVFKSDPHQSGTLEVEARMLRDLEELNILPSPKVLVLDQGVLCLEYISNDHRSGDEADRDAAELLAALHGQRADQYGYFYDTRIGGLPQDNTWSEDWWEFYTQRRLVSMAKQCVESGLMEMNMCVRLEKLGQRLPALLGDFHAPGLVHGDVWGGNVLNFEGRLAAFVDPALYFADPEIEIAFTTMFSTFGPEFYARYNELRPLHQDFWSVRKEIYLLYPLLVHVRLMGRSYLPGIERTLRKFA